MAVRQVVTFTPRAGGRIEKSVRYTENVSRTETQRQVRGGYPADDGMWVELTAESATNHGWYKWKRVIRDTSGAWVDHDSGLTSGDRYSAASSTSARGMRTIVVRIYSAGVETIDDIAQPLWGFERPSTGLFKVKWNAGSAGSAGTASTWNYDLYPFSATTAEITGGSASTITSDAVAVEVEKRRVATVYTKAADGSVCHAYWNGSVWKIVTGTIAEQIATTTTCSEA